jgi:hypothetical protein
MGRLLIYFLLTVLFPFKLWAQSATDSLWRQRLLTDEKTALVLGTWSAANFMISLPSINSADMQQRYYHRGNMYWNVVNVSLATLGYFHTRNEKPPANLTELYHRERKMQVIFGVNALADVGYVASGVYLMNHRSGDAMKQAQLNGFGQTVIVQGAALLVFDAILYAHKRKRAKQIRKLL